MPHCIVEYSLPVLQKTPASDLIEAVFDGVLASKLFTVDDIKCRAKSYEHHIMGTSVHQQSAFTKKDFVHVEVRILSGRNSEQKSNLSRIVLERLQALNLNDLSLSVEINDIDKGCYSKIVC